MAIVRLQREFALRTEFALTRSTSESYAYASGILLGAIPSLAHGKPGDAIWRYARILECGSYARPHQFRAIDARIVQVITEDRAPPGTVEYGIGRCNQGTRMTATGIGACLLRGFAVWILIALAETVHGTLRTIFLEPKVGDLASRQIGVLTGSLLILVIAYLTIDWIGANKAKPLAAVGSLWFVLMLAFEVMLGRAFGLSCERILSDYLPWQGGFMVIGMTVLALSPAIAFCLRSRRLRRR